MSTPEATVRIEKQGAAAHVTLSRPPDNLIDGDVIHAFRSACETLSEDSDVRAVIVTGDSGAFSGGWDWDAFLGKTPEATVEALRVAGVLDDPFACVAALPKPVIAAVNGPATGGGLALALACDIRIASEDASFALAETRGGLVPLGGAPQRLARLVGRGNALGMILTGETILADQALRIGLVSEVVTAGELPSRAEAIAGMIAARGPIAVQYAKEAVVRGIDMPLEQAMRYETDLTVILQTTQDRAEGVRAFRQKRRPRFMGR